MFIGILTLHSTIFTACSNQIEGLAQDCSNSIANALELLQSCAKPSKCFIQQTSHGDIFSGVVTKEISSKLHFHFSVIGITGSPWWLLVVWCLFGTRASASTHHGAGDQSLHYSDLIMSAMASPITGVSSVCSVFCSCVDERKHQSSASLETIGDRWIPLTNAQ